MPNKYFNSSLLQFEKCKHCLRYMKSGIENHNKKCREYKKYLFSLDDKLETCEYCLRKTTNLNKHYPVCKIYLLHVKTLESSITKEFLIDEYINKGKSIQFITDELNFKNPRNIKKLLIKYNIKLRNFIETCNQDHTKKLKENTNLNKYGVKFILEKESPFLEQSRKTVKEKYGCNFVSQNALIKEKMKETCQERYGVDYACQSDIVKEKTKITCQEKYGSDNPWGNKEITQKCLETKLNSNKPAVFYSEKSQNLFYKIYNKLPKELQEHCYFAKLNKEFGKYDNINKRYYFYDFAITNINFIIEYNGNYYHANPDKYNENFYNKHLKSTAKEIREKDKIKNNFLINKDYNFNIIWEDTENEEIINNIVNKILNLYNKNITVYNYN